MANFKHSYCVITTTFDLEPLLEEYLHTYPQGDFESYEVVFKTEDEHRKGDFSYIVVFVRNQGKRQGVEFSKFLASHCIRNNLAAVAYSTSRVLPQFSKRPRGHVFGDPALAGVFDPQV